MAIADRLRRFWPGDVSEYIAEGRWLATSDWNELKILDAGSFEVVHTIPREQEGHFRMFAIDECPRRGLLAAGYLDGMVRIWEIGTWREVVRFQPNPSFTFGLAFSPDGSLLATGGNDGLIRFWDVPGLVRDSVDAYAPEPLRHREPTTLLESDWPVWFSRDGTQLITRNRDVRLHRWDTRTRRDLGPTGPNLRNSRAWTISGNGEKLAVAWPDGRIDVWNLEVEQLEKSFARTNPRIARMELSDDATLLAVARRPNGAGSRRRPGR